MTEKKKYTFKIFGVPLDKAYIEIEVKPEDTIEDVKRKIIEKAGLPLNIKEIKLITNDKSE